MIVRGEPVKVAIDDATLNRALAGITLQVSELQSSVKSINLAGNFLGASDTFASLPQIGMPGDFAILRVDDGVHKRGFYRLDAARRLTFIAELGVDLTPALEAINQTNVTACNDIEEEVAALTDVVESDRAAATKAIASLTNDVARNQAETTTAIGILNTTLDTEIADLKSAAAIAAKASESDLADLADLAKQSTAATAALSAELAKKADQADVAVSQSAQDEKIRELTSRKEIKEIIENVTLIDGNSRPSGAQASGFNNDGAGPVAGATSWNSWIAVGQDISQAGGPDDIYEIAAGFAAAASFGSITVAVNGTRRSYTQGGLQPGTLPLAEFSDGNWRGVTLTVTGNFTGSVDFVGFNGAPAYIGPVVRRRTASGYSVDSDKIALARDVAETSYVNAELAKKASSVQMTAALQSIADLQESVDDSIASLTFNIGNRPTKKEVDDALALKADKTALDADVKALADYKAANDASLLATTNRVKAIEDIPVGTAAEVQAKNTSVRRWTPATIYAGAAAAMANSKAIVDWSATTTYGKDQIVMRNKAFFVSNVGSNAGKDPSTDSSGAWAPFAPGEVSSLFFNRGPTSGDVYPAGAKWYDLSFGSDTPLVSLSLGNGAWTYLNQVTLAKARIYANGILNTYRSSISNLRFYKPDGAQIPNSWFVWGTSSGISGGSAGVAYVGQQIYAGYNSNGYVDIEVSSAFDPSITIGSIVSNYPDGGYINVRTVEFWYSNGSRKVFTATGTVTGANAKTCTCDPPVICRYGDATAAAQGEMLTGAKLGDATNNDYGRISGAAFSSAFNQMIAIYESRIAALEAKIAPA